jgi:hypothetical protein
VSLGEKFFTKNNIINYIYIINRLNYNKKMELKYFYTFNRFSHFFTGEIKNKSLNLRNDKFFSDVNQAANSILKNNFFFNSAILNIKLNNLKSKDKEIFPVLTPLNFKDSNAVLGGKDDYLSLISERNITPSIKVGKKKRTKIMKR